jgi:hypothetical protein
VGEVTDLMLDGVLCQCCGVYMDDLETKMIDGKEHVINLPGYPRTCKDCKKDEKKRKRK